MIVGPFLVGPFSVRRSFLRLDWDDQFNVPAPLDVFWVLTRLVPCFGKGRSGDSDAFDLTLL